MQARHIFIRLFDFGECFSTILLQKRGRAVPRSLLFIELGSPPTRDIRRGFVQEGFKIHFASGIAHAQGMLEMRSYNGCAVFAAAPDRLAGYVTVLARCSSAEAMPIVCVADLNEAEQIDILECGGTLCLPATVSFAQMLPQLRAIFDVAEGFPVHFRIHDLGIDPVARRASRAGRPLALRRREFDMLVFLAERAGRTVPWEEIHQRFWPREELSSGRVAVYIHNLRRAIGAPRTLPLLHTVRGSGYSLSAAQPARVCPAG